MSKDGRFVGFVHAETMAGLKAKINLFKTQENYTRLGVYWETRKYELHEKHWRLKR